MHARRLIPLLLALVATKLALDHVVDSDIFWHLRLGLDILERGRLPTGVEYSWTGVGQPYLANDWLAEILFALAFRAGGLLGVALLKAGAAAALALVLYAAALVRSDGNERAAGLAVVTALFVGACRFVTRPVLLGHVCLAVVLLGIELIRRGRRGALVGIPAAFALWVNLHGSWPVGAGPLAAALLAALLPFSLGRFGAESPLPGVRRRLAVAAGLGAVAVFASPVGTSMLLRPFRMFLERPHLDALKEWSPVPWSDPSAWMPIGAALFLAIACWRGRKPLPAFDLALVAGTFALAALAVTYALPFAVILAPILSEQLAGWLPARGLERRGLNAVVAVTATVLFGAIGIARLAAIPDDVRREEPLDAVAVLEQSGIAHERGFNYFDYGGYLVFRKIPTYADGRLEPFLANGIFDRYLIIEKRGDIEALEAEGAHWVLAKTGTPLARSVSRRPGWRALHRDSVGELWLRESAEIPPIP